jgi:hypothetical protein
LNPSTGAITGTVEGQGDYQTPFTLTDAAGYQIQTTNFHISIAGDNTFGGQQLMPSDSAFHINVSTLPVDTSPVATIYTGYQGASLKALFGESAYFSGSIPINTVPYNQPFVTVNTTGGGGNIFFNSAPINCNAEMEGTFNYASVFAYIDDNHIPTVVLAGGGNPMYEYDLYGYFNWPYSSTGCTYKAYGGYQFSQPLSGSGAYTLTNGSGSTDAAGLPLAPLLLNYDEVAGGCAVGSECGVVKHPVRFTLSNTLNYHVWPATTQAGLGRGSCSSGGYQDPTGDYLLAQASTTGNSSNGYGPPTCSGYTGPGSLLNPMGEIYRLKSSVTEPAACSSNPALHIIFTGFQNYGIILADNGETGAVIGTPDTRWPVYTTVTSCIGALTLADFEPVAVDSLAVNFITSSQTTSGTTPAGTQFGPGNQRGPGNQVTKMGWPAEFWRDVRSTAWK